MESTDDSVGKRGIGGGYSGREREGAQWRMEQINDTDFNTFHQLFWKIGQEKRWLSVFSSFHKVNASDRALRYIPAECEQDFSFGNQACLSVCLSSLLSFFNFSTTNHK